MPEGCQAALVLLAGGGGLGGRTRGQRHWEAITSLLRPALIPSHSAPGAGSPNKAQSG